MVRTPQAVTVQVLGFYIRIFSEIRKLLAGEDAKESFPRLTELHILAGDSEQTTAQAYIRHWFRTYDQDCSETPPVTEYHLPMPVMETFVVLFPVAEEELFPDSDY